ncbi:hypothetical protein ES702_02954 [subsurface metagenome]
MNWTQLLATLLFQIIKHISPVIKESMKGFIAELKIRARATDNPFDDLLVLLLEGIFSIEDKPLKTKGD